MTEKTKSTLEHTNDDLDFTTQNFELLESSELGIVLRDAYKTAVNLHPEIRSVEIASLDDDSNRVAFAQPSWNPESGGHNKVHVRLNDLDKALENTKNVLDNIPGARKLFGDMLDVDPSLVTPQLLHVFSFIHELGHTQQYLEHADDPTVLIEQTKKDKEALPIGRATVTALMDKNSFARKFVEDNWHQVIQVTGVKTIEELIEKQHGAYRQTKSEKDADDFARDVFATNPQLVDQLTSDDLDYYRNFKRAA